MLKSIYIQVLEDMVVIFMANFKGRPLSCALLPYGAAVYLNALVEAEKHARTMVEFDRVAYYRKIERLFVDDWAGTAEMNKMLNKILHES